MASMSPATPPEITPPASRVAPWWIRLAATLVRLLPAARYRAMNLVCRRIPPPFVAPFPGSPSLRFECDLRNVLAREAYFIGRYEPQETAVVKRLLGPGGTFLDAGANWGYFTLLAADLVGPRGLAAAIEADPRMLTTLRRSLALNRDVAPQLRSVHAAVAAGPGVLRMRGYDQSQNNWGVSSVSDDGEIEVESQALDAITRGLGIARVDLLKIDIEGAEGFALEGMREGLAQGLYRNVLIELHPEIMAHHGHDARDVSAAFLRHGYRGWTIRHGTADVREAAYARDVRIEDFLTPFDPDQPLGSWPHQLWVAPAAPAPFEAA
jgi:FkbM family methyltransferase